MNETIRDNLKWVSAPVQGGWTPLAIAVVVLLLAVGGGIAGYLLWWRRKKLAGEEAPPPPPHLAALEALRRLRERLDEDNYLEFIVEVSSILRVYIQGRFGLRAPHRSTEEFLAEASESPELSPMQQELLGAFLGQCDLVKFARRQAALTQMERLFATAQGFVEDTIPRPRDELAAAGSA